MSKSSVLYKDSPTIGRDEQTGKVGIKRPSPKEAESALGVGEPIDVHQAHERREMHHRHAGEHLAMHHRHEMAHVAHKGAKEPLHKMHEDEMASMHSRHHAEMRKMHGRHEKGEAGGEGKKAESSEKVEPKVESGKKSETKE